MSTPRILSVLQVVGHPRHSKRISMLQEAGFHVEAVAFQRDNHAGRPPSCKVESLGFIENGQYVRRVVKILQALPKIRKLARTYDVLYASGLDIAVLVLLATPGLGSRVILEVGDIRRVQVSAGLKGKITRWIDKWVARRCRLIVISAAGFESWYYREQVGIEHEFLLLENKLEVSNQTPVASDSGVTGSRSEKIRIGYFGVLRCEWSLAVLVALAKTAPDRIEIKIAGYTMGTEEQIADAEKQDNITYHGTYKSPDDLTALYTSVDLMWACYPGIEEDDTWRTAQLICRSNRFYESCYYRTPIITLKGSGDSPEVVHHDIGCVIDNHDVDHAVEKILAIQQKQLSDWRSNMQKLPRSVFEYTDQTEQLKKAILAMN